jgi:hypothetical protein
MNTQLSRLRSFRPAACLVLFAGLAPIALADLPGALDRIPANAPIVVAMRDMEGTNAKFTKFMESVGFPVGEGDENPMAITQKMLGTAGLNGKGSAAFALIPGADGKVVMGDEGGEPTVVAIVPVSDFAAFVKAMGAEKADGVTTITFDNEKGYAKDLGGGYAALSPTAGLLEKFEGKAGASSEHAKALGKNGGSVADSSDMVIIANIPFLQDQLKAAADQMAMQAEQMAAMAGEQGAGLTQNAKIGKMVLNTFARDAQVGVLGFRFAEKGVSIDLGAQFKEGSEIAKFFAASGKASALLGKVPNLPFYFAGAMDMSAPGIKQIVKNLGTLQNEGKKPEEIQASMFMGNAEKVDGMAFVLGASNNAMMGGGLFVNTVMYTASKDPKAVMTSFADALKGANGQKSGPVTTTSTYKAEAAEVSGVKVDTWTSNMEFDPNDPMAAQAQMMSSMIFGQGMTGMNAGVDSGIVSVYSQNTPLMTSALEAAKSGKGALADDALLKEARANLPEDRTMEFYIGVKPLMDAAVGAMAMFGGGPEVTVPPQLSPIAAGGSANNGGVAFRMYVPSDVIKGISEVVKQMDAGEDEEIDEDADMKKPEGDKPPRF